MKKQELLNKYRERRQRIEKEMRNVNVNDFFFQVLEVQRQLWDEIVKDIKSIEETK
jgi:hypothetical protein